MNDETKVNPRVFFARVDKDGRKYASGVWDDGTKIYMKNFRDSTEGQIADVDFQTDEQYENKQGKLVFRHKICGAVIITPNKATLVIEYGGKKERLTCEPRQVNAKATGEPMLILDFGNGASLNPYVDEVLSDEPNYAQSQAPNEATLADLIDDDIKF